MSVRLFALLFAEQLADSPCDAVFSFLLPGPKPKVVKKSTAVAPAPIKPATAVAPVAEIPVVEKKEEPKGVTTRAGKGKAVQVE